MSIIGYARVSSRGQSLDVQLDMLKAADCTKIFQEKKSGLDGKRVELARCIEYVRDGDTLLVTKLDRLARSTSDFYRILKELQDKGVAFRCLDNKELDTTTKHGKLMIGILSLIAEFETAIRKERQMDGIARAKENKVHFGRTASLTEEQVEVMKEKRRQGTLIKDLMAEHKLSKAHVYRLLDGAAPRH